jgi:hypothetical protein
MASQNEQPQGARLTGSAEMQIRLFGQSVEWSDGYFDDRSRSENLAQ